MKFRNQIFAFAAFFVTSVGYAQIPEAYKGKTAVFVPSDDKTYFMNDAKESISPEGNYQVEFLGVIGDMAGDKTPAVAAGEPNSRIVFRWRMIRKYINTPTRRAICVPGNGLCVIIVFLNDPGDTGAD